MESVGDDKWKRGRESADGRGAAVVFVCLSVCVSDMYLGSSPAYHSRSHTYNWSTIVCLYNAQSTVYLPVCLCHPPPHTTPTRAPHYRTSLVKSQGMLSSSINTKYNSEMT